MAKFLHERHDFEQLLSIVADDRGVDPMLVEKDYWIMHCLWGLQNQGYQFQLKGGTSLSKGYNIIHRFSEDIDIRIEPPKGLQLKMGRNHNKPAHVASRRSYYDELAAQICIPGIDHVERDTHFDDDKMRSGGIRLSYTPRTVPLAGIKSGILLELGFDDTTPNRPITISSWALDIAINRGVNVTNNRAVNVPCYVPTHTFVEKLQTISTKYRLIKQNNSFPGNFLRHYYDVYCLLALDEVQNYMQQPIYQHHKARRFRQGDELIIAKNPAFLLSDTMEREKFSHEYRKTEALYYQGQISFETLIERIHQYLDVM